MRGMTVIVKTIANIVCGFIFLYGVYITLHGHLTPGGGFAGGCIVASAYILLTLAHGRTAASERMSSVLSSVFESIGALLFITIALLGLILAGVFFYNFLPPGTPFRLASAGTIPLSNIAIGIKVSAALFSIFLALAAFKFIMEE